MPKDDLKPLVSICCVTYNHEKYITRAIEGFLMQKTSFPLEIIICDDASTDGTTQIIKEYERKNPALIRGVYQSENQYSKGILPYPNIAWPQAKGKYIALCEGDDYWTDPDKIKKQVSFLEENPAFMACAHESIITYDKVFNLPDVKCSVAKRPYSSNKTLVREYSFKEVADTVLFQSTTLVFRNETDKLPDSCKNHLWDVALFLFLGGKGKIHFMKEAMSVYRKHVNALTMSSDTFLSHITYLKNLLAVFQDINKYFDYSFDTIIKKKETEIFIQLGFYSKQGRDEKAASAYMKAAKMNGSGTLFTLSTYLKYYFEYISHTGHFHYHKIRRGSRQLIKKNLVKSGLYKDKN